ncbi:hypothetical protein Pssp01_36430 [Pseudomonas sp. NBRC 100443]|nr:hypothetical protein Pssp01_36430 [Pseudomonas sp. NBRC 100443]
MLVDVAGQHHQVGVHRGQLAAAAEVLVVQVGKDADTHAGCLLAGSGIVLHARGLAQRLTWIMARPNSGKFPYELQG